MDFPGGSAGKESACNEGDLGSIPGLGRSPGEWKVYPPQCSGLVHGIAKSQTRLSDFHFLNVQSTSYNFPGGPAAKTLSFYCRERG